MMVYGFGKWNYWKICSMCGRHTTGQMTATILEASEWYGWCAFGLAAAAASLRLKGK
jgi:hypothetical protein